MCFLYYVIIYMCARVFKAAGSAVEQDIHICLTYKHVIIYPPKIPDYSKNEHVYIQV